MAQKPYQSCLIPHEKEIIALRRKKPPVSYAQIAILLMEKYNLSIQAPAIFKFVKVRSKGYKTCSYAWGIEQQTNSLTKTPPLQKQAVSQTTKPMVKNKSKPSFTPQTKDFNVPFSENYNLHILSPEAAAALQKQLEEENQ